MAEQQGCKRFRVAKWHGYFELLWLAMCPVKGWCEDFCTDRNEYRRWERAMCCKTVIAPTCYQKSDALNQSFCHCDVELLAGNVVLIPMAEGKVLPDNTEMGQAEHMTLLRMIDFSCDNELAKGCTVLWLLAAKGKCLQDSIHMAKQDNGAVNISECHCDGARGADCFVLWLQAAEGKAVELLAQIKSRGCKEEFVPNLDLLQEGKVSRAGIA
jgi:hypothetical protein